MGTGAGTTGQEDSYYNRGGGSSGDQSGGAATGGGATGGGGEAGTVSFRYEVYSDAGYSDFLNQSGYTYSSREDARDAGLAAAKAGNARYVRVRADKTGFGVSDYTVPKVEEGVEVSVGAGGETVYTGQGDVSDEVWDPRTGKMVKKGTGGASGGDSGGGAGGLPGMDNSILMYLIVAIVIIAIMALALRGGS